MCSDKFKGIMMTVAAEAEEEWCSRGLLAFTVVCPEQGAYTLICSQVLSVFH